MTYRQEMARARADHDVSVLKFLSSVDAHRGDEPLALTAYEVAERMRKLDFGYVSASLTRLVRKGVVVSFRSNNGKCYILRERSEAAIRLFLGRLNATWPGRAWVDREASDAGVYSFGLLLDPASGIRLVVRALTTEDVSSVIRWYAVSRAGKMSPRMVRGPFVEPADAIRRLEEDLMVLKAEAEEAAKGAGVLRWQAA